MRATLCLLALLAVGCADTDAPPTPAAPPTADASFEARFPDTLGGLERRALSTSVDAALGESVTETIALYGAENSLGEPSLEIYLTDYGSSDMAEMMGLAWGTRGETDYEATTEVQASETFEGEPARRTWDSEVRKGRLQVLAGGTLFVEVRAEAVPESVLDEAARVALAGE